MSEKWYMRDYREKTYLHNKTMEYMEFCANSDEHHVNTGDHAHCELCWNRFSNYPDDIHSGYYERDSGCWICEDCFKEMHLLFGWQKREK